MGLRCFPAFSRLESVDHVCHILFRKKQEGIECEHAKFYSLLFFRFSQ
ncbi:hypothetical protein SAMN02745220_03675 [Desulfopila aestuarii DSM 18488]|uniref:Uncharacterized protein n=1 Tax=Desulfopila aestuarii DSM 18488 TaxID=1121416 RepID=A0A1M7YDZ4_9BACT|nr:hypothetical protein SAMN02745220_03675 [Desulfopila aestuarii DSM 18488]